MSENTMDDFVPRQVAGVETEVVGKEVLLYHPGETRAVYLNPTAALIWGLCDGNRAVREIVRLIGESYPDAGKGLADEVRATLKQMQESGVIVDA
jgi:pyrroloquinoline quinone biosynthesis protein D